MSRSMVAVMACAGWLVSCSTLRPSSTEALGSDPIPTREDRVVKTAEEWRTELTPHEFHVLREKGTERAFTGEFHADHSRGTYTCAGCGLELFSSDHKFDSGTGWPSFTHPLADDVIDEQEDRGYGMVRTEVVCARCGGHLGHVFRDGPRPTGLRYCINSVALDKISAF